MLKKSFRLLFLPLVILISCSSSKDQIASNAKYKLYIDSVYNKPYYMSDDTRIYVVLPEELKNKAPEFVFEDSKGYTFASINDEIVEVEVDTTNALYMGYPSSIVTNPVATKENITKKNAVSKVKKKVRTTKKTKTSVTTKKGS
jgi:hypothetical protein